MPKTLKRSHQIGFTVAGIGLALVFFFLLVSGNFTNGSSIVFSGLYFFLYSQFFTTELF